MFFIKKLEFVNPAICSLALHTALLAAFFGFGLTLKNQPIFQDFSAVKIISGDEFKKLINPSSTKPAIVRKSIKGNLVANNQKQISVNEKLENNQTGFGSSNSNQESKNFSYANILANKLEQQKEKISLDAAPNNIKTKVVLKIKLSENGALVAYKIIKDSSNIFFDRIAKKMVNLASPFPAPPADLGNSNLEFIVPISFDTV